MASLAARSCAAADPPCHAPATRTPQPELARVLFPAFAHTYLNLVAMGAQAEAQVRMGGMGWDAAAAAAAVAAGGLLAGDGLPCG